MKRDRWNGVRLWVAGLACGAAFALSANVAVGTGETFVFTNSSDLAASDACVTLADGATFRVAAGDATRPGFILRRREEFYTPVGDLRYPRDMTTGFPVGREDTTHLMFDVEVVANAHMGVWTHWGRWRAPETGEYSFFSAMDDAANVLIDGVPVLKPTDLCRFTVASNVFLAAGWHTIQVHIENASEGRLGRLAAYPLGLGWTQGEPPLTPEACGKANRFRDMGDGADVQKVHSGMFYRRLDIPAGTATLDMTASGLAGPFAFGGSGAGLRTGDGAQLRVKGCTNLVFNGKGVYGLHFPLLDADVAFEDNPAGVVRLYGQVSLERMRPNYVVDPAAEIAYWGAEMLTGTDWTLTNAAAHLLSSAVLAPTTTVVVAAGGTLTLKPCEHDPADTWRWKGIRDVFTNDFVLAATDARLRLRAFKSLELKGALRGNGRVVQIDNCSDGPFVVSGDVSQFSGTLQAQGAGGFVVRAAAAGDGTETVVLGGDGKETNAVAYVQLQPPVEAGTVATGRVNRVEGRQPTAYLFAGAAQELRVRRFAGIGGVKTENLVDAHITVDELAPGARLVLRYTANVTIGSVDAEDAEVRVVGTHAQASRLELADGAGALPVLDIAEGAVVELAGTASVARVTGAGTLVVSGAATLPEVAAGVTVRTVAGGVVRTTDAAALAAALGARPALWLDAAQTATCEQYLNCVFTNGIVVRRWNDCRPEQTALYGLNPRGEGYVRVYPYVKTNALNGLNVVSTGAIGGKVPREYGHVTVPNGTPDLNDQDEVQSESRRLPFNQPIVFRTAIAVVNSALGGGAAILGGFRDDNWKDLTADERASFAPATTDCLLARGGTTAAEYQNPATPIFARYRRTWVDGEAVDPTVTGYSGGWQIVSFESATEAGEEVRSLGMQTTHQNAGGIDYAEVLIYTNALTAAERRAVERHLAHKWGVSARAAPTPVNGTGRLVVEDRLHAAGVFAGTVEMKEGARLDLASVPPPPGEADVPEEGRAAWFDPDRADDLVLGANRDGTADNLVYALFDRGRPHETGTRYLHGTYNPSSTMSSGDRRPRAVRAARGDGPARTWLVFREDPESPTFDGGNTLRLKTDVSLISNATAGAFYSFEICPTRTAFIVMDSCWGGGTPILDKIEANGLVRRRTGDDFTKPIWAGGTAGSLTGGVTRLNGAACDGVTTGFTGAPEVFSFTTTNDFPAAFFGSYKNKNVEGGTEVLGEILLYDRVVAGAERDRIECYLMNKWLGVATGGACDWRRATVTGAGTVAAARAGLPALDAAFTGTLALADTALAFHVDTAGMVTDALALPAGAALALPEAGALTVSFAGKPVGCTLATAGAITGIDPARWTVALTPTFHGTSRLVCTAGALRLEVIPDGTVLLFR